MGRFRLSAGAGIGIRRVNVWLNRVEDGRWDMGLWRWSVG